MIVVVVGSLLLLHQRAYLRGSLLMLVTLARWRLYHLSSVRAAFDCAGIRLSCQLT